MSSPALAEPPLLSDPATFASGVPYEELARLRRESPVVWVEEKPLLRRGAGGVVSVAGSGYWAVTRYSTVAAVSHEPSVFSSAERGAFLADPTSEADLERTRRLLINMDAPEHARIRRFVASAFTPRMVGTLRERIRAHARSLVDRALRRDELDAVRDLAAELPLLVLADLLGMPREDRELMFRWSNDLVGLDDPQVGAGDIERYKRAFSEAFAYSLELAEAKRARPGDDLVSGLVRNDVDGGRLGEVEFSHLFLLIVVAGNETTRHLLSGSLQALAEEPEERDRLVARPDLMPSAVEELLRFVSPVMQFRRTAMRDAELEGQAVRAGDKVVLYYVSANRDEEVFAAPERLDLGRQPNPHVAFGIGPHFCLGAHLARAEAAALLECLLPHLASFELTAPPVRLESNFMNGLKSLPARFRA